MTRTLLQIDASARLQNSATRDLTARIVRHLSADTVIHRDLSTPLPQISEDWVNANFTPADQRTDAQRETLALSDELVDEIARADTLVIGVPVYNFSIPAALKAWIDQIARAGLTFKYGEDGPQGLMSGRRAILAVASGGTPVGADYDYATGYMRHILGFIGISDVEIVAADSMARDPDAALARATSAIEQIAA